MALTDCMSSSGTPQKQKRNQLSRNQWLMAQLEQDHRDIFSIARIRTFRVEINLSSQELSNKFVCLDIVCQLLIG